MMISKLDKQITDKKKTADRLASYRQVLSHLFKKKKEGKK